MEERMKFMKISYIWNFIDLPLCRKAIGNKWVFKIKRKLHGSIEQYKARLVAKGYT